MIFYFSGTGNNMHAAQEIATRLNENSAPLRDAVSMDLSSESRIGFVFPTYNFMAPKVVTNIIMTLQLPRDAYYFVIGCVGAQVGNSLWQVKRILESKGCQLAYSNKIRVPDNSAIAFGRNPNDQAWKFTKFAKRWESVLSDLENGRHELHYAWWDPVAPFLNQPFFAKYIYKALCPETNADKCTGCSICAQVCPVHNITISTQEDKKIAIHGNQCEFCLACVHFCPVQATKFNHKLTARDHQYHHPNIKWKDLK